VFLIYSENLPLLFCLTVIRSNLAIFSILRPTHIHAVNMPAVRNRLIYILFQIFAVSGHDLTKVN